MDSMNNIAVTAHIAWCQSKNYVTDSVFKISFRSISYLAPIPEILWFGEIDITEFPPTTPASMFILYVRSPDPMASALSAEVAMVISDVALTVRAYRHLNRIESSTRLKNVQFNNRKGYVYIQNYPINIWTFKWNWIFWSFKTSNPIGWVKLL